MQRLGGEWMSFGCRCDSFDNAVNDSDDDRASYAKALEWAHRITTISVMMVLPGLIGYFVDQRLGTVILFTVLGFLFGMAAAIWQLMKIVAAADSDDEARRDETPSEVRNDEAGQDEKDQR